MHTIIEESDSESDNQWWFTLIDDGFLIVLILCLIFIKV